MPLKDRAARLEYQRTYEKRRQADPAYRAHRNAYQSAWKKRNRATLRASDTRRAAEWRRRNPDRERAKSLRYARAHPEVKRASCARRFATLVQRTVAWANPVKIRRMYKRAVDLTRESGRVYEVDHVIPLRGKLVSGLHVHENMRVVLRRTNRTKSARYVP